MHVGKGVFLQNLDGPTRDAEVVAAEMDLALRAEAAGFDSLWAAEHHFDDYHMCPNVPQMLSFLAGRTTTALLGSMVIVLPWHHPVRVAEELAMLDHLSGGRVVLGLGRGLGRIEFDGFGVPMAESRTRFVEYAEALVQAFDTGKMSYHGELLRQSPVALRPRPLAPLRGRVYAAAVSPSSQDIMAKLGFGLLVIPQKPWEATEHEVAAYRERFVELNDAEPPAPLVVTWVVVHESAAAAQERYERYLVRYARSTVEHYEFGNEALAEVPGYEYYGKLAENLNKRGLAAFNRFLADLQVHGTPDAVTERLVHYARRLDAAGVVAVLSTYGGMDTGEAARNQALFAASVLPALKRVDPHRALPACAARAVVRRPSLGSGTEF
jgi:alkanesulfonate monooxygenase SsuD/methylene tetrahydromethanopterin reductase-like flavin-dependent oxidoreductase (luciferase family)